MSKVSIQGNASGTGTFTIAAPNSNSNQTLTLPDQTGTVLNDASSLAAANLTGNVDAARITSALNATGSAPIYACRAWVNFNGTGTVAIRASGNVSSITDIAAGTYTINLTNAMPDANYAIQISTGFASGTREDVFGVLYNDAPYTPTTTAYTIKFFRADTNVAIDTNYAMTSIFR